MPDEITPFSDLPNASPLLPDYTFARQLGQGGFGITYLAHEKSTQQPYVIKQLSFERLESWKDVELFEREARTLQQLQHPRIPRFKDLITQRQGDREEILLIQAYIAGDNLEHSIESGHRLTEEQVVKLGLQMAEVLEYLHGLHPPVIHRDIKPANIILKPDGESYLVDFGAVRDQIKTSRGSTIIGTYGYMAPEQYDGRAYPATDIYALGVTLIYALTHTHPGDMEKEQFKLDYRPHGQISYRLSQILDSMIAPDWKARFQSATELRQALSDFMAGRIPAAPATPPATLPKSTALKTPVLIGLSLSFALGIYYLFTPAAEPPQTAVVIQNDQPVDVPVSARWQGELRYNGQPLDQFAAEKVSFWFRNENTQTQATDSSGHYQQGKIWFSDLPEARVLIQVSVDANPNGWAGDYERSQIFTISDVTYPLNIDLHKVIHLTAPVDNMQGLAQWGSGQNPQVLPVWPAPMHLAWEALDQDVVYKYRVERHQYQGGKFRKTGTPFDDSTRKTELYLQLPPSGPDEFYIFKLEAYSQQGKIGLLTTHGQQGGKNWDYRFRVP